MGEFFFIRFIFDGFLIVKWFVFNLNKFERILVFFVIEKWIYY